MECTKKKRRKTDAQLRDKENVKRAAARRWHELYIAEGMPACVADGSKEHPCAKCGGNTRMRLVDAQAGALRCSRCCPTGCGDGFAALAWWLELNIIDDFPKILKKAADFFGVKIESAKKSWKEKIELLDWNDALGSVWANLFCWTGRTDPSLIAGIIIASWLQAFWDIRPLISMRGDSELESDVVVKGVTVADSTLLGVASSALSGAKGCQSYLAYHPTR